MKFHFSDTPPSQLCADFQTIQKIDRDTFTQLIIASVKLISGELELSSVSQLYEALDPLSEPSGLSTQKLANLIRSITLFLQGVLGKNLKPEFIEQDAKNLGLDDEKSAVICQLMKKYFVALSRGIFSQTLSIHPLLDMDWKFGVTASSSELDEVGSTFLQLKLTIDDGGKRDVFVEMSLQQFYDFLHEMEKAQSS
ncbi:hypothetical protein NAEGRDRAFT_69245 [Naegleria gruberi]|uniref:Uncharacterized protein AM49 n=1 Tax=Naegleria gruberi TaxID=5762 RepID=D2VK25_NAEGR|nr:uncharacterized protein NAEGRDRAFT_69245 [Naegleria gruberi]EFC42786.1 hypothetical protein NAEGRDRAFT_69245 [Naegleria gruberi]|eukprot:XP_002675530.1 hypothetical protein NAEGRDRAFT_69245 [Naegleria gruberi strain NEG-M]